MTLGIRGKLLLISLGLIASALLISDLVLTSALDKTLTGRTRSDLMVRAELAEREANRFSEASEIHISETWQNWRWTSGPRAQARLTLIALDGEVLGDSISIQKASRKSKTTGNVRKWLMPSCTDTVPVSVTPAPCSNA
ncbi:MAG: hypothetical protein IPN59_11525 [Holophaga sp.]|nr:hypothetical protein [Holophaga sp.]